MQQASEAGICRFRKHEHIVLEGQPQRHIYRLEDGWACRYRLLRDGRRQITALFLPGDYCEPQWLLARRAAAHVVALTNLRVHPIALGGISSRAPAQPDSAIDLLRAISWTLDRQSEHIVSLGRKTGYERLCELICDLFERLRARNRVSRNQCNIPLTQQDIADVVGLTPVHVNRLLQKMRRNHLIEWKAHSLTVRDVDRLRKFYKV